MSIYRIPSHTPKQKRVIKYCKGDHFVNVRNALCRMKNQSAWIADVEFNSEPEAIDMKAMLIIIILTSHGENRINPIQSKYQLKTMTTVSALLMM